jgi:hypothetical protein
MPTRVDLAELFEASPGDGVPLGLVDDPRTAGVRTLWWEPGYGSLFVFGSRRAGVEQALATVELGILDRFSALDVRLIVVEPSSARRRALAGIDRPLLIVSPDSAAEVDVALDEIADELARCAESGSERSDGPRLIVVIGDLVHLRRHHATQPLAERLDELLTAAALSTAGVDVIAYAAELEGAGPFAALASRRLVGASSDHGELVALGVDRPRDLDGVVGRCRSFPGAELVQLASTDTSIEALLARRSIGGDE